MLSEKHKPAQVHIDQINQIVETLKVKGDAIIVRIIPQDSENSDVNNKAVRLLLGNENINESIASLPDCVLGICGLVEWLTTLGSLEGVTSVRDFRDEMGKVWVCAADRISQKFCLYIFGAGHVGQAVGLISNLVGYKVIVIDDRQEFVSRKRFPDADIKLIQGEFDKVIDRLDINHRSAAIIVTRGHQFDEICLQRLLKKDLKYLGMIGSKRRVMAIFKRLGLMGFSSEELKRVHAPIGLSIGAKSPQEIAIAIIGEIISELNRSLSSEGI